MIWRRFLISSQETLGELHRVIDEKPQRRLFEVLQSQGLQMNQQITFLSDARDWCVGRIRLRSGGRPGRPLPVQNRT